MKPKKSMTRRQRLDRYLYRNSFFYKWGKRVWKSRSGKLLVVGAVLALAIWQGIILAGELRVRRFLLAWQRLENRGDYAAFTACLDTSSGNPYRQFFPDWKADFFDAPLQLELQRIRVKRLGGGKFRVDTRVLFLKQNIVENQFNGVLYLHVRQGLKIYRIET